LQITWIFNNKLKKNPSRNQNRSETSQRMQTKSTKKSFTEHENDEQISSQIQKTMYKIKKQSKRTSKMTKRKSITFKKRKISRIHRTYHNRKKQKIDSQNQHVRIKSESFRFDNLH
jgi:catabolite regulation protein CreA